INAARTTLTAVLVVGWMLAAGGLEVILTLSVGSLALLAVSIVLAIAIGDTIFFESTQRLGLGRAMTISMSYPVVAASLAALLLGERLTAPIVVRLLALAALTAVSSVMYGVSVKYAGVAVAAVLSSTAPLFAVPLGIVFLGERLPLLAMIGAAVTVAGIVVLRL